MLRLSIQVFLVAASAAYAQTGTITGKVIDAATNQPIPKIHVSSTTGGPGDNFVGTLTGSDGAYTLENVPAGSVHMILNLDGYKMISEPPGRATFPLAAGETIHRDFVMHPQGRISGRIVDRETGKAIAGHTVMAVRKEWRAGQTFLIMHDANQNGDQFDITNLEPGDYLLEIVPDVQAEFVFPAGASPKPAPKKVYGITWYPGVSTPDLAVPIHLAEGESRRIEVSLESRETHSISGTVTAPREMEGQPITMMVESVRALNGWVAMMPAPGTFRIDDLPPGRYSIYMTGGKPANDARNLRDYTMAMLNADYQLNPKPAVNGVGDYAFEIGDRDVDDYKIALHPYAGMDGQVRMLEENIPLPPKLGVALFPLALESNPKDGSPLAPGPNMVRLNPVKDGHFHQDWLHPADYWPQLNGLPSGYAIARIEFEGAGPRNSVVSLAAPDTPITFVLTSHPGAISGIVRDSNDDPVPGATVFLLPDPLPDRPDPTTIKTGQSAKDGSFTFADLAPGHYRAFTLPASDDPRQGDPDYLRQIAAGVESVEVTAGQSARVELKQ